MRSAVDVTRVPDAANPQPRHHRPAASVRREPKRSPTRPSQAGGVIASVLGARPKWPAVPPNVPWYGWLAMIIVMRLPPILFALACIIAAAKGNFPRAWFETRTASTNGPVVAGPVNNATRP